MRFGVCCRLEDADSALRAGADYVEVAAWPLAIDPEYAAQLKDLPVEATNLFMPSGLVLKESLPACLDHGKAVIESAERLGIPVVVVGSGGARRFPEEEKVLGLLVFVDALEVWSSSAKKLRLAPESLNREETNVGNDLNELATLLSEKGIGFTADSYHVLSEWRAEGGTEGFGELWEHQVSLVPLHVHVSDIDRRAPGAGDPAIESFFQRLKLLGYDARMSFECRWNEFEAELVPAMSTIKQMWRDA